MALTQPCCWAMLLVVCETSTSAPFECVGDANRAQTWYRCHIAEHRHDCWT
jgi:hypothetical protein